MQAVDDEFLTPEPDDEAGEGEPARFTLSDIDIQRTIEALVFASSEPVSEAYLADRLPRGTDVAAAMHQLAAFYAGRGVNLLRVEDRWAFRTAADLSFMIRRDETEVKKLSRAALEVLAIIAYHQPVTRAEIEEIRGVQTSKGTLDVLMEAGWVRFRGRRRSPGRPVTLGTTISFLDHFGLEELRDLPGLEELKGAGLLSGRIPPNFNIPIPSLGDDLTEDEDPITQLDLEELGLLAPSGGDE
ncbi:SMC-Scp complex subunit ScpB [Neorhizobium sp. BT27B]|uniref:SMC-Scp complex subunit ScpB n=1 Tax=Neorhizobium sp. BT27B TaxID=3142625 RepID=UPI0010DFC322|nr:condensin subunit ScpB [Neorhizobium sp. JUb45]